MDTRFPQQGRTAADLFDIRFKSLLTKYLPLLRPFGLLAVCDSMFVQAATAVMVMTRLETAQHSQRVGIWLRRRRGLVFEAPRAKHGYVAHRVGGARTQAKCKRLAFERLVFLADFDGDANVISA